MFKILAIGNRFSEDATHYLHRILEEADPAVLETCNGSVKVT